jgi:hypothetical protein
MSKRELALHLPGPRALWGSKLKHEQERMVPFASLKKQAKTLFWLIFCERKILFQLKK